MPDKLILSGFRFFSEVSPKTIEALESACKVLDFPPQTVVYRPGEAADTLYCLAEGEVELSLEVHDKSLKGDVQHEEAVHRQMVDQVKEIVVDTARSRQIFGWTALVGEGFHEAVAHRAIALESSAQHLGKNGYPRISVVVDLDGGLAPVLPV